MTTKKGKQKILQVHGNNKKKKTAMDTREPNEDDDFMDSPPLLSHGGKKDDSTKKCSTKKKKKTVDRSIASTSGEKDEENVKKKRRRQKNPKGVKCKRRCLRKVYDDKNEEANGNSEEGNNEDDEKYPKLNTRSTPAAFYKKLRELNDAQRRAIEAIGFGKILQLTIKDVPSKLAYWVLDRYDSRSGVLEIDGTCKVKIEEDDVYRVFGFPKGAKKIDVFERTAVNELFNEWMGFFQCVEKLPYIRFDVVRTHRKT
ncbi:uncharacterized protein LOC131022251 [Salvia miltiorrhiza]|uniref:uncharacterized protein LOC131022251 n=1 Tax=Salvia miltiorrhiza TaxID=226208 RepID=UPI0025ABC39A|nr:uncharacterized protein LOC131022251 [Salvia miltiorrhiza]XP_057807706.1 uncharacterized protein LOC131022251 [Salvia miltiorrhiza]